MRWRKADPGPPPFIDQFGRPVWTNPQGRYRPNPALSGTPPEPVAPPLPSPRYDMPIVRVQGWEAHERHLESTEPVPPPPVPPTPEQAQRIAELMDLLGDVDPVASAAPASSTTVTTSTEATRAAEADSSVPKTRAERLAERAAEQRVRGRVRARRIRSIVIAGVGVFGVTAAYGFWTGGADAGSRTPKPPQTVTAEATAGMPSSPLAPGGKGNVKLRVDNPNAYAMTLTGVAGGPFPSAVDGSPGCTITNSGVSFTPPATLDVNIPARSTVLVRLVGAAAMGAGAAPECRGHTFTIPVSVRVRKA